MELSIVDYSRDERMGLPNRHPLIMKSPFRLLIIGASGSGKTNLLMNMLTDWLIYDRLVLCLKNPDQPVYEEFIKRIESVLKDAETPELFQVVSDIKEVPDISSFDSKKRNLVVFDDFLMDKDQKVMKEYFVRGRPQGISVIYISQSFYGTPITIRQNCSAILLARPRNAGELAKFPKEMGFGLSSEEFEKRLNEATKEKYNWLYVDHQNSDPKLQWRKNFDHIWEPTSQTYVKFEN